MALIHRWHIHSLTSSGRCSNELDHVNSIRPSIQFTMEKEQDNKLPFLNVLVACTEQGFRSSVYHKSTFTGHYLNFNSHHPYNVKKGIIHCLQHRAKAISSNIEAYKEGMISLRHNLHHNNYLESITLVPRNLDRRIENNTQKLTTVCLPYVKGLAERIQKICSPYDIMTIYKWLNSPEVSFSCQTTNRIQHNQELCVLNPL